MAIGGDIPALDYRQLGLVLRRDVNDATSQQVRDFAARPASFSYLSQGIDGVLGPGTEAAVSGLREDLLMNDGSSTASDGSAPVKVLDYNRGRVTEVTASRSGTGAVHLRYARRRQRTSSMCRPRSWRDSVVSWEPIWNPQNLTTCS